MSVCRQLPDPGMQCNGIEVLPIGLSGLTGVGYGRPWQKVSMPLFRV